MKKRYLTPIVIFAGIFLILGIFGDFSYGFYTFIRLIAAIIAAIFAYLFYQKKNIAWVWIFGIFAVIFQPLIRIPFGRGIWQFLDFILLVMLIMAVVKYYKNKK